MPYLLFCGYLLVLLWLIYKIKWLRHSGISLWLLLAFFIIKVFAGIVYGYVHSLWGGGDTWEYFTDSFRQMAQLRAEPARFFTSIFAPGYETGYGDFFGVRDSWWNDLDWIIITKLLALLNLISGTNYYIDSLFFNVFSFTGTVLLLKVWQDAAPSKKTWVTIAPFLLPGFLFWTSGIHKENLLVFALGLIVYATYFSLKQNRITILRILAITIGLFLILVMRNYLLLPVVGALCFWIAAEKLKSKLHPMIVFAAVIAGLSIAFFGLRQINPAFDFPQVVVDRLDAFNQHSSTNRLEALPLKADAASFYQLAPKSFLRAAFRPMPQDVVNFFSAAAAAESVLVILLLLAILPQAIKSNWRNPFLLFCLFLSISILLTIGFTVVFPGAIVRYRSVAMPFFLMPALAMAVRQFPSTNEKAQQ